MTILRGQLSGFINSFLTDKDDGHRQYVETVAPRNWRKFGNANKDNYTYDVVRVAENDTLKMRSGPGHTFAEVGTISTDGRGITFTEPCSTMWCKVRYSGHEGWVYSSYLSLLTTKLELIVETVGLRPI